MSLQRDKKMVQKSNAILHIKISLILETWELFAYTAWPTANTAFIVIKEVAEAIFLMEFMGGDNMKIYS